MEKTVAQGSRRFSLSRLRISIAAYWLGVSVTLRISPTRQIFNLALDDYRNAFRAHYRKGAGVETPPKLRSALGACSAKVLA
jgi:hypothetical protein